MLHTCSIRKEKCSRGQECTSIEKSMKKMKGFVGRAKETETVVCC